MKVFIDILTPKQCLLFTKLAERLRNDGHSVLEVTREYKEVIGLLGLKGVKAQVVGRHGGQTLQGKLKASAERVLELVKVMQDFEPDVVISLASPETSRVAFGLGIPHICLNDSPHAEAVARLTVPLATLLLTPRIIAKSTWTEFGISPDRIVQYNALDAWAWLKHFKPNETITAQLGLEKLKPIIVFRTEESFASYLVGKTPKTLVLLPLIQALLETEPDFQAVVIPRYETQIDLLTEKLGDRVKVCKSTIDATSLLSYASVFVGAGGTMTAEAALLGVPTFSCYPDRPFLIESYLIRKKLVIREANQKRLRSRILKTLRNIESVRKMQTAKARLLTSTFEDPIDVISEAIKRVS